MAWEAKLEVAILGAGLSGLAAAHRLAENGISVDVYEKQETVGGLAKTITHGEFSTDLGPHRFHSKAQELTDIVGGWIDNRWTILERRSRIYMEGKFFDYPLRATNAILTMPPLVSAEIMIDYLKASISNRVSKKREISFEDWVVNRFGRKLYDIYFGPYNLKLWGIAPAKMSKDWAIQRISLLNLWDTIVKTIIRTSDEPRTYISRFHYPTTGGIGLISDRLKQKTEEAGGTVHLSATIISLDLGNANAAGLAYKKGNMKHSKRYDLVLSSIPITSLMEYIIPKPPDDVLKSVKRLKYRSIVFACVIVNKKTISDDHWIYLPQAELVFNRIAEPKNFGKYHVPEGKNLLCTEITCKMGDGVWSMDEGKLGKRVIGDLVKLGFIKEGDVEGFFVHREEHAYPIYDLDYKKNLEAAKGYLHGLDNIISIGRNGLFRYDNMDHSINMGLLTADLIIKGNLNGIQKKVNEIVSEMEFFGDITDVGTRR